MAGEPLSGLPPARWTASLEEALRDAGTPALPFRLVRSDGRRAVVRVDTRSLPDAKRAWNRLEGRVGGAPLLVTRQTWGTLVGAKAWLARPARLDSDGGRR